MFNQVKENLSQIKWVFYVSVLPDASLNWALYVLGLFIKLVIILHQVWVSPGIQGNTQYSYFWGSWLFLICVKLYMNAH